MPPARTGTPIATYDVTPIGKGVANLGRAISQASQASKALKTHQSASDKYDAEARFQEFKWNQMQALDQAKNETTPDQVDGFTDRWLKGYQENSSKFLSTIPDSLKERYDLKLKNTERQGFGNAARFMREQQKRTAISRLGEMKSSYIQRSQSGASIDEIKNDYANLVKANPYLSEIEKDAVVRKDLGEIEIAHAQSRWKSSADPDAVMRDLGGALLGTESNDNVADPAKISIRLETGKDDPLKGVSQIAQDSGGSKSYGNFGLNSGGSAQQFVAKYGEQLGLTAEPGTAEFDKQWKNAAGTAPDKLHAAEMEWYQDNVVAGIKAKLANAGVPDDIATDSRVQAYFADRIVQQGPGSIDGMDKHKRRIGEALADADGDAAKFLKNITEADRAALRNDFPTALKTGTYSSRGHDTRLNGRLKMALGITGKAASAQPYKGPYKNIPGKAREKLMKAFQNEYNTKKRSISVLKGEVPVDPADKEDRETIDKAADVMLPVEKFQARDPQAAEDLSKLADKISYVPKSAFSTLRGMAINGTNEDRAYAYQIFGRLMRERPGALKTSGGDGFNKELADEVETFNTMVADIGIPPEQAIGRIDEMRSADFRAMRDSRRGEAEQVVKDLTLDDITKVYGGWFTSRPSAGGSDRRSTFMLDAYRDAVRYHYVRSGDPELAKKVAINEITKTYKVSTITGNKRLMRHPPEHYYPPIQTDPDGSASYQYFQEDLKNTVNEIAGRLRRVDTDVNPELRASIGKKEGLVELGEQIPLEDIYIEANSQTAADIAAGISYPSYSVVWKQKDENGIPVLMTAPTPFYVDVKAAQARQLEIQRSELKYRREQMRRVDKEVEEFVSKYPAIAGKSVTEKELQQQIMEYHDASETDEEEQGNAPGSSIMGAFRFRNLLGGE